MKFNRTASAYWEGGGKDGRGLLTTQSEVFQNQPYGFDTRFEDKKGTNPEELIGAALSGCYTMQLSFFIEEEGFAPESLRTDSRVYFEDGKINRIDLDLKGKVPGMKEHQFKNVAERAKKECPVGKLLNANISLDAELVD